LKHHSAFEGKHGPSQQSKIYKAKRLKNYIGFILTTKARKKMIWHLQSIRKFYRISNIILYKLMYMKFNANVDAQIFANQQRIYIPKYQKY